MAHTNKFKEAGATRATTLFMLAPSQIRADHRHNSSRTDSMYTVAEQVPELAKYGVLGDSFCFTRAQVLERAESFLAQGQIQEVTAYPTSADPKPVLRTGFLRHAAMLYLEHEGKLGDVPRSKGSKSGLRFREVARPQSSDDQVSAILTNAAENAERVDCTPVDIAWLCKRLMALKMPKPEICEQLKMSDSAVTRHLRLLALPVADQLDVHEGRRTMTAVLGTASANGDGPARGVRRGRAHSLIKRVIAAIGEQDYADKLLTSDRVYSVDEVLALVAHIGGVAQDEDATAPPPEFVALFDDAPEPKKKKPGRPKKAPATPAETAKPAKPVAEAHGKAPKKRAKS